jgi:glycosyltransferase involved in cell wall biosynthesis
MDEGQWDAWALVFAPATIPGWRRCPPTIRVMSRFVKHPVASGEHLALSALCERLNAGSLRAVWRTDPDGVLGRVLELPTGGVVTYPLRLDGPVTLTADVRLYPHDWRDLRGAVCARVAVTEDGGAARTVWSAALRAGGRGPAGGCSVSVEVPAGTTALHLSVSPARRPEPDAVARAIWVDPALWDVRTDAEHPRSPRPAAPAAGPPPSPGGDEPMFSVLVPVHDPPVSMLDEAVGSVRAQTFGAWELCLADDGSRDPHVIAALERHAASDPRIRLVRQPVASGISAATNAALSRATGRYIALLDHDDTLAPDALEQIAARIAADPALDMVYSDEDIVDGGRQVWVHLKPAWSPDTLRTNGYTCHLGVYRRSLVEEIGGFRSEFDGSQDIDMILRLTERSDHVAHVPAILYHWRAHAASTAGGDAKPYAYVAARSAYAAHLDRTGIAASVGYGPPGLYRVAAPVDPAAVIAIALAVPSADGLTAAARSWAAQPHDSWRAVLTVPEAARAAAWRELTRAGVAADRVEMIPSEEDPAVALATAAGRAAASGADHLLILQSPSAGLTHDWLARLAGYAQQPGIAAAGPVVLAPDGRVAEAGVALPEGIALHLLRGSRTSMDDFFGYGTSVHNVSALSGALLTPGAVYQELGGLDPALRELALVEYCIRAGQSGRRIVTVPDVRLRLSGSDDAVNDLATLRILRTRWGRPDAGDPFYNAGYRPDRGDFSPRGVSG